MGRLTRGLALAAGITGGMAAFNITQELRAGPLMSEVPGKTGYWHSPHGMIFYKTIGEGEPVVLVHGFNAAASSYEMRCQAAPLSERFKVYAFDWLGYGLSERPSLLYTAELYAELLNGFLREVVGGPAHIVASSQAAACVIQNAATSPELYRRLLLITPTGIQSLIGEPNALTTTARNLVAAPVLGTFLFNLLASKPSLRSFLERQAYYDPSFVTDEMVEAYFVTGHQPGARYAPASFLTNYLTLPIAQAWAQLKQPTCIAWGEQSKINPVTQATAFLTLKRDTRFEVFHRSRLLPHDEEADHFNALALDFLSDGAGR
ncbi:MAG: alpha/beta fold hydrolase [Anaerolineae bacterium]